MKTADDVFPGDYVKDIDPTSEDRLVLYRHCDRVGTAPGQLGSNELSLVVAVNSWMVMVLCPGGLGWVHKRFLEVVEHT